ncbi:methyl-accepting chemotaxis protein [Paludibacterium yongneupense]|uniref:methyl-accepting chemotaxis protein n=1 Tax=Paludibacterium yongneupense TaxID=400061 RepID=UPI00048C861F|nr:methyl-accepting chemotaxis protein [Paludibacterium yongneupense]
MNRFNRMTLRGQLLGLVAAAMLLICGLGAVSLFHQRASMLSSRQEQVRNQVDVAATLVRNFEDQAASGRLGEAQAQALAAGALSAIRYDNGNYFFVINYDFTHYVVIGPKPALVGSDPHNLKDPSSGQSIGALFAQAMEQGGGKGYINYYFPRAGSELPQPKIAYITTSERWHWRIGTGMYVDDVDALFFHALWRFAAEMVVVLLLMLGMSMLLIRNILRQLGADPLVTTVVVQRIASNQLDEEVVLAAGDQSSLLASVANMQQQLRKLVREISMSSKRLSSTSAHVTENAVAVAQGSEQQSQAAASMAAAVEQLTVSIQHISDNANDARNLSEVSGQQSQEGSDVIAQAAQEMRRIHESVGNTAGTIGQLADKVQRISTIMQVIRDISDQTNLLALNAAIEAARAGETGRGFAVVADEVRKLSERTGTATQEIAGMIADIQSSSQTSHQYMGEAVERVGAGLALAEQGGVAVARIRESAMAVVQAVNEISGSLAEQGKASQEIAQLVEKIALSSSNNATASATVSEAVVEMRGLSDQLRELVSRFRL